MSGLISEMVSSFQNEGPLIGVRQIFIKFQGCSLNCIYCNTPDLKTKRDKCRIEIPPGSGVWTEISNPVDVNEVQKWVKKLISSDLHSYSLTGGEPLDQPDLIVELSNMIHKLQGIVYLDSSGYPFENYKKVASCCDYVKIDLKSPDSEAIQSSGYDEFLRQQLDTVRLSVKQQKPTIIKTVIMDSTDKNWFEKMLSSIKVNVNAAPFFNLTIQPVTPYGSVKKSVSIKKLFEFSELAAKYIPPDFIQVSPQMRF
jgi:organic radical activating enzyme